MQGHRVVSNVRNHGHCRTGIHRAAPLPTAALHAAWGGYESLALAAQPERLREHRQWTGDAPVVWLHIGLEDPQDLIADLAQALAAGARAL